VDRTSTIYSEALPDDGAPPRCQLVVIDGPDRGRAIRLDRKIVVGTRDDCDLTLADDRVSGRHVELEPDGARFRATDLESTNGTLFEGSLIARVVVPIGATFKIGKTFLRILPVREPVDVEPSQSRTFGDLVGESLAMREVFAVLELAADSDITVLLEGETGTGKELAARAIHEASARKKGPFVAIDCGALPEALLESELFGHVRGAFTGASATRKGAFARADGGTIFLDELGAIAPAVQARLLRVLEQRTVKPVGADDERPVDVRVVAATRDDLDALVATGAFRPDLSYRISVLKIVIPPLRARREDIRILVETMMKRSGLEAGEIRGENLDRLLVHDWPGNVRELRNAVERATALSPRAASFAELSLSLTPMAGSDPLSIRTDLPFTEAKQEIVSAFELRYLRDLFTRCDGNVAATAREAQMDRKHLRSLLEKHGLL
jgi:DNA-binding NtrC family response regulator